MSDQKEIPTLDELEAKSDALRERYDALCSRRSDDRELQEVVGQIRELLDICVVQGRYTPIGTPERRSLRNIVDYWVSRLSRDRRALDDRREGPPPREPMVGRPGAGAARSKQWELEVYDPTAGIALLKEGQEVECPYPGLNAYDEEHAAFFSRKKLAKSYSDKLKEHGALLIYGGSGSGKSSVALAGVRHLWQNELHKDWSYPNPVKPGTEPLKALAASVLKELREADAAAADVDALAKALGDAPKKAAETLAAAGGSRPMLLIIDQFEEIFTLCKAAASQGQFAEVLLALSQPGAGTDRRLYLLLTLRSDHFDRFENQDAGFRNLYMRLQRELLPPISAEEIREAIIEPAKDVRLRFVPADLPSELAGQTVSLSNGLPLLQFALQRLWAGRARDPEGKALDFISKQQVDKLPTVERALGERAKEVFDRLEPSNNRPLLQGICKRLILELLFLAENHEEPLRRRRSVQGLCDLIPKAVKDCTPADVRIVMDMFAKEGLLRISDENTPTAQVEVSHEALLRRWEMINNLIIGEAKPRLHRVKVVEKEAAEWKQNGESKDLLKLRGEQLANAKKDKDDYWLEDGDARGYVEACVEREEADKRAEEEREALQQAEQQAQIDKERAEKQAELAKLKAERDAEEAARKVAEQQAKIAQQEYDHKLEKNKLEADAAEANRKLEESRARETAQKKVRKMAVGLGLVIMAAVGGGAALLNSAKNTNLGAVASLSERLQPWEGLDVVYSLAKQDKDFRLALGHALERMDGVRIPGGRNRPLYLVGDGAALLQIASDEAKRRDSLSLYRLAANRKNGSDWLSKGLDIPLDGQFQAGDVGKEIKEGAYKGSRLFVVMLGPQDKSVLQTWLIDWDKGEARKVGGDHDMKGWRKFSTPAFRPDGLEVKWVFADDTSSKGVLLTVGLKDRQTNFQVDEAQINDKNALINALAYIPTEAAPAAFVSASGAKWRCGNDPLAARGSDEGMAQISRIVAVPGARVFVIGRADGAIELASCDDTKGVSISPLPNGNPDTMRLSLPSGDKTAGAGASVLSYQIAGGGFRCYEISREKNRWQPKEALCNGSHPVGDMALFDKSLQIVIEGSGLSVVRSYPSEFSAENWQRFPSLPVQLRGSAVLCPGRLPQGMQGEGDWHTCGKVTTPPIVEALSPGGTYFARATAEGSSIDVSVWCVGEPQATRKLNKDYFGMQALAVDDGGRAAFFKRNESGVPYLVVDGKEHKVELSGGDQPTCLAVSPGKKSKYLVIGTSRGRSYRVDVSALASLVLRELETTPGARVPGGVTACAIAEDGAVALGLYDGNVLYAASSDNKMKVLTEKAVYGFPTSVGAVRVDGEGGKRRVTALGGWQLSDCVSPALPGKAIRAWEMDGSPKETTPVSVACFPNEPVLALGEWRDRGTQPGEEPSVKLFMPTGERWHACPACRRKGESDAAVADRLVGLAEQKGAQCLNQQTLKDRYGLDLGRLRLPMPR